MSSRHPTVSRDSALFATLTATTSAVTTTKTSIIKAAANGVDRGATLTVKP